jgi:hypothetical protein
MDVHHVAGFVVAHCEVAVQGLVQAEVIEGVFGSEVGCAQIAVAVGDENLEMRVDRHGFSQDLAYVNVAVLEFGKRPGVDKLTVENLVRQIRLEFQLRF